MNARSRKAPLRLARIGRGPLGRAMMVPGLILPFFWLVEAAEDWRIEAGLAQLVAGALPRVNGYFYVHAPAGTPADAAPRSGGACLVADLVPFGVGLPSCETTADCNAPEAIDKASNPALENFQGYCAAPDGSREPPKCWTRPGLPTEYCNRSPDGLRLTPGMHVLPTVPADPLNLETSLPDWAVLACMAEEGHPAACGEPANVHRQLSMTPRMQDGQ